MKVRLVVDSVFGDEVEDIPKWAEALAGSIMKSRTAPSEIVVKNWDMANALMDILGDNHVDSFFRSHGLQEKPVKLPFYPVCLTTYPAFVGDIPCGRCEGRGRKEVEW